MKIKGISAAEQHVEKIVLGAVSLVFLAVLAMQFLLQPNKVTVGRADPVPPGEAFATVESKAIEVRGALQRTEIPLPEVPPANLLDQFRAQRSDPVSPRRVIADMGRTVPIQGIRDSGTSTNTPIAAVAVPPPTRPVAAAGWSTIDPGEIIAMPELKKLVPAQQPFDKLTVSLEVHFDGTALAQSLLIDPDGDGPIRAVPSSWWRDNTQVFAVRLQREELASDGTWANPTNVPGMPGRIDLVAETEGLRPSDMPLLLSDAKALAEEIQRPAFYRTVAGPAWVPPAEAQALNESTARTPEQEKDYARLAAIQRDIETLKDTIAKTKAEATSPGGRTPPPRGPGGRRGGEPGGEQDEQKRQAQEEKERKDRDRKLADLDKRLKAKEEDAREVEARLIPAGMAKPDAPVPGSRPKPLLENPDIRLWANDLTAEPGKTYRYRATIAFNNPVFGKAASLVPEQQSLAEQPFIVSAASEWSEPVEALADSYYFIVSASEASQFGPPRAAAKLYKMYYGYYREGSTTVEPGDAMATDVKLPDPNRLPIFDLTKISTAPGQPTAPPPDRDGGRRQQPGEEETRIVPGGRDQPPPTPEGEDGPPPPPKLPPNAAPGPKTLDVSIPVVLLDVARTPSTVETGLGAGKEQTEAFMRGESGLIIVRNPDTDRTNPLIKRIQQSVLEGETQGQPSPTATTPTNKKSPADIIRERLEKEKKDRENKDPGPDGGGGGGG